MLDYWQILNLSLGLLLLWRKHVNKWGWVYSSTKVLHHLGMVWFQRKLGLGLSCLCNILIAKGFGIRYLQFYLQCRWRVRGSSYRTAYCPNLYPPPSQHPQHRKKNLRTIVLNIVQRMTIWKNSLSCVNFLYTSSLSPHFSLVPNC